MNDRQGTYQALWFVKKDLKEEKSYLIDDIREINIQYRGSTDPGISKMLNDITYRIDEINSILRNIETGYYKAPE